MYCQTIFYFVFSTCFAKNNGDCYPQSLISASDVPPNSAIPNTPYFNLLQPNNRKARRRQTLTGNASVEVPENKGAVGVRRGHALAALVEHGRLELLLRALYGVDAVGDEVEYAPEAARVRDQQLGELPRMVADGLDRAQLAERSLAGRRLRLVGGAAAAGQRVRLVLEHKVLVDAAGHEGERGHVKHVDVARLEAQEQVAVVGEERERRETRQLVHHLAVQLVLFDLQFIRICVQKMSMRVGIQMKFEENQNIHSLGKQFKF